jgi:cytoskeletal protein RodZ
MDVQFSDPVLGPRGSDVPPTLDDDNATVGQMLRVAREQRGLTLEAIRASTKIPLKHLSALERDDLEAVPPGMYQRAEVRTFADAVGLDPRIALDALERARSAASASFDIAPASGTVAAPASRSAAASDPRSVASSVMVPRNASGAQAQSMARLLLAAIAVLAILIAGGSGLRSLLTATPAPAPTTQTERADAAQPPATRQKSIAAAGVSNTEAPATAGATQLAGPDPAPAVGGPVDFPNLHIVTEPSGARVTVDGIGWGETPLTIRYLPPGSKRIRVTTDGYIAQEQVVELSSDVPTTTVRISLRRRP